MDNVTTGLGDRASLQAHIKAPHNKIQNFSCGQCDYKSSRNYRIKDHVRRVHEKVKETSGNKYGHDILSKDGKGNMNETSARGEDKNIELKNVGVCTFRVCSGR